MDELECSKNLFENVVRWERDIVEGVFVHFESHKVMGHGLINLIDFVDAYFFGFDNVFPEALIEGDLRFP